MLGGGRGLQPGSPVGAVHHLQVDPQVLLGEVIQHASVHEALHEVAAVLGEPQAGGPTPSLKVYTSLELDTSLCLSSVQRVGRERRVETQSQDVGD